MTTFLTDSVGGNAQQEWPQQQAAQGHPPETVRLYRYRDDEELWQARPDMRGLPVTAHAALLARVRTALLDRGQSVAIEYA